MSDSRPTFIVDKSIAGHWRVTLDNPPINVIDDGMYDALYDLVGDIEADVALKVVTFESAHVGRGVAIHEAFGTIVGEIAEVAVSKSGEVKVQRVVACVDCGYLVNPLTAAMQIESAVMYGLTAALFGEINIKQGRVEQGKFRRLPDRPNGRCAGHRDLFRAVRRRQMGRARGAGHSADCACDRQRGVRGHRQTHPLTAAQEHIARGVSERRPTSIRRSDCCANLFCSQGDCSESVPTSARGRSSSA
jgi:Molybdopterin-binding domain of aldehyde dehydrogenase